MYDPVIGRWLSVDPARQFYSPYLGMGNNPIILVDSDGRWVHIAAGALIGGGIAAYNLYKQGQLDWSLRSVGKIALGAGTGALVAAIPGAGAASAQVAGISTRLVGGALTAGAVTTASNICLLYTSDAADD